MEITITLTDAEYKALSFVAVDPQDWVQNAASVRALAAMDEIFQAEIANALNNPKVKTIPANREQVVLNSTLPLAAERLVEFSPPVTTTPEEPVVEPAVETPAEPVAEPVVEPAPAEPVAEPVVEEAPVEPLPEA